MRYVRHLCLAFCSFLLVAPLWVTDLLPLADAPQHAALLAIGVHWPDQGFPYSRYFEVNWIANSLAPYAVSYLLAQAFSALVALKLVLTIALLGIPLATTRLVKTVNGDPWWVFTSFPVAYGYAFIWGFVPFVLAVPLGLLLVDTAIRFRNAPKGSTALGLVALVYLLFACHVLVLAYAGLVSTIIIWSAASKRARLIGSAALASVVPLIVSWWVATKILTPDTTPTSAPLRLAYGLGRVPELFGFMVGAQDITYSSVVCGQLVMALPFLIGARPSKAWWRYAPIGVAIALHFVVPLNVLDTAFVYPRFTIFVVPGLLAALDAGPRRRPTACAAAVLLALVLLALITTRFHAFGQEASGPAALLQRLEPNKRLLALIADPRSRVVPGYPYLNFGNWYPVFRGGIADFSFAEFFPNRFRYRHGMDPPLPYNVEWFPQLFVWSEHGGALYDYFLVQGDFDPFKGATTRIELVATHGSWAVYRQFPRVVSSARDTSDAHR
jgi:hypothetical protein